MRHYKQKYRLYFAWLLFSSCVPVATSLVAIPSNAYAQMPTSDSLMLPHNGEKAGELAKGQLFVTALRAENLDYNSIRLAMQSIGKLFDFRLSRAGDRYLYKAGPNKKLTLLRYQRAQHVYEAVLNQETGEYDARVIETAEADVIPPPPPIHEDIPDAPVDDDGEIDVEREAIQQPDTAPEVEQNSNNDAGNELNDLDVASPDDPIQPVDAALVGKISPDEELPSRPGFVPSGDVPETDKAPAKTEPWREENFREDNHPNNLNDNTEDETQEVQHLPGTSAPIVQPNVPVPVRRIERESVTFSTISLVLFGLGSCMFIFAIVAIVLPAVRLRRRSRNAGMKILDLIQITPTNKIARVSLDGHECLVGIHPDKMSFIAPCPPDDDALWKHIQSKTYWYQMVQTPVSDRQLSAIIKAFYNKTDEEPHDATPTAQIGESHESPMKSHGSMIIHQEDLMDNAIFDEEDSRDKSSDRSGLFSESDIDVDAFFSRK